MNNSDEQKVQEARAIIRRDYYASVRSIADDVLAEMRRDPTLEVGDVIHQMCDGHHFVIFTHANFRCLDASNNWTAADDEGVEIEGYLEHQLSVRSYYALRADVLDEIDAYTGFDSDDWADFARGFEDEGLQVPTSERGEATDAYEAGCEYRRTLDECRDEDA